MDITLSWEPAVPIDNIDTDFLQGMLDRMMTSYFKYGQVSREAISKRDTIATIDRRLTRYLEDHNTEWLMDVANFCMIEFMFPTFADAFYQPTEGEESPGVVTAAGEVTHAHERDMPNKETA